MIVEYNKTYIGKFRVRTDSADALSTRLRLDRAFSALELRPSGLPKSAVVFIRKLRDPLPGSIPHDLSGGLPEAWRRAAAAAVEELTRRAARPALQDVGAEAESVLFLDRSELLACLAADWIHGRAITRWWWQSLFRATDVMSAVVNEWLESIRYVPAAFAKAAQKGYAALFVSLLPAGVTGKLLNELIRQFGLYEFSSVFSPSNLEAQKHQSGLPDDSGLSSSTFSGRLDPAEASLLQTRLTPEAWLPGLAEESRLLLALALMLERSPSLLRDRGFASRLLASFRALDSPGVGYEMHAGEHLQGEIGPVVDPVWPDVEGQPQPGFCVSGFDDGTVNAEASVTTRKPWSDNRVQSKTSSASPRGQFDSQRAGVLRRDLNATTDDLNTESNLQAPANSAAIAGLHPAFTLQNAAPPEILKTATTLELAIETKLGGVFYLINAGLSLDLYGDFTKPLEPGIELSIWDFLALAARELIGERVEADAIWPLLAKLAGRDENEQPGAGFEPPAQWRVPPDWLKAFPESEPWGYQTTKGRLIVWHPAGFKVLDLKTGSRDSTSDLRTELSSETSCYPVVAGFKRHRPASGPYHRRERESNLDRWSGWLADYLRVRLSRSLGLSGADGLSEMLFTKYARVEVSPARLDVFFKAADLSVEIRLAGLDRDPGWVPAAGRAIAFHYD